MFHGSIRQYGQAPRTILVSLLLYVASWISAVVIAGLVFAALKYPIPWSTVVITSSIVVGVKAIPVGVPFEIGIPEIAMTSLYILLGVPALISSVATVLTRLLSEYLRAIIGFGAQQWVELKACTQQNPREGKTQGLTQGLKACAQESEAGIR